MAPLGDTWVWNGISWQQLAPAVTPGLRELGGLVCDPIRQRLVLFGGTNGTANQNDTWEWNGATWVQVPTAVQPSTRQRFGMVFDGGRGKTVVFGGSAGAARYNDVWEYDGATWAQAQPSGVAPVARDRLAMVYDAARGKTVLFGGRGPTSSNNLADTWEWDGAAFRLRSAPSLPSARSAHGLADNGTGVILFGGQGASGRLQDTWNWDGANWTALTPSTLPPSRSGHALSYDSLRRRTMLFGGLDASGAGLDDTWLWNGADWAPANPPNRPAARSGHTLAFDSVRGRTILFGGLFAFTALALDDTWEWDGAQWISFTPSQLPPGRTGHALAFDAARGRTVLFGGSTVAPASVLGDTWEWNGTSWLQVSPTAEIGRAHV